VPRGVQVQVLSRVPQTKKLAFGGLFLFVLAGAGSVTDCERVGRRMPGDETPVRASQSDLRAGLAEHPSLSRLNGGSNEPSASPNTRTLTEDALPSDHTSKRRNNSQGFRQLIRDKPIAMAVEPPHQNPNVESILCKPLAAPLAVGSIRSQIQQRFIKKTESSLA
jgi:hypothetical protein